MAPDMDFGFEAEVYRPDISFVYCPPWETGPIEDEGTHLLIRDQYGIIRRHGEKLCIRGGIDKRELAKGRAAIDRELERIRPAYETGRYGSVGT